MNNVVQPHKKKETKMHVEKTIDTAELAIIVRKHFEAEVGQPLAKFTIKETSNGSYSISYDTALIQPTVADKAKEQLTAAVSGLKTLFGKS